MKNQNLLIAGLITLGDLILSVQRGYRQAIDFTETGDTDQPEADAEWYGDSEKTADDTAADFVNDNPHIIAKALRWHDKHGHLSPCQFGEYIGHDLWLTRNHHGSGFWDNPEVYGEDCAKLLTEASQKLGETYTYKTDCGKLALCR